MNRYANQGLNDDGDDMEAMNNILDWVNGEWTPTKEQIESDLEVLGTSDNDQVWDGREWVY